MGKLLGDRVWSELTPHLKRAAKVEAAIGYVSSTAEAVFAPPEGSRLIVDGSDPVLRQGLTAPAILRRWKSRGIEIRSVPALHAKCMVITPRRGPKVAVVGSANASKNSAHNLRELSLLVDDDAIVESLEGQFEVWWAIGDDVTDAWLDHADGVYRPTRHLGGPRRVDRDLVDPTEPLWLGSWVQADIDLTPEQHAQVQVVRSEFAGYEVEWWRMEPGDEKRVRERHTVVLFGVAPDGKRHGNYHVFAPARVSTVLEGTEGDAPVAVLVRRLSHRRVRYSELRRVATAAQGGEVITHEPIESAHFKEAVFALWS